jgi:hypothetical protein
VGIERIGDLEVGQTDSAIGPFKLEVSLFNSGRTPALHVYVANAYKFYTSKPDEPYPTDIAGLIFTPGTAMPPQGKQTATISENPKTPLSPHWAEMVAGREFLVEFGDYRYDDVAGRTHVTQFCMFLPDTKTKKMAYCSGFNEMN